MLPFSRPVMSSHILHPSSTQVGFEKGSCAFTRTCKFRPAGSKTAAITRVIRLAETTSINKSRYLIFMLVNTIITVLWVLHTKSSLLSKVLSFICVLPVLLKIKGEHSKCHKSVSVNSPYRTGNFFKYRFFSVTD